MQKTREEIAASIRSGFGAMSLVILSVVCFIVFLWIVMTVVRFIAGLAG